MFLFTKTVIKSDLQQILLLMCFSAYLSNKCTFFSAEFLFILLYSLYYAQSKLLFFTAQSFKKNQESLYYLRPGNFSYYNL